MGLKADRKSVPVWELSFPVGVKKNLIQLLKETRYESRTREKVFFNKKEYCYYY